MIEVIDRSPFDASLGVYSVQSAGTHSRCFNYGRMYVALIRVTSSDNFYLIGSFTLSDIKADPRAIYEYQRLRNERQLSTLTTSYTSGNSSKTALLNTRSLNKHGVDISKDKRLPETDILCLTETHVMPKQDITGTNCLDQFQFYHNKSTDKFESLVFACTNTVGSLPSSNTWKTIFSFIKLTFMEVQLNILLLYHKITNEHLMNT